MAYSKLMHFSDAHNDSTSILALNQIVQECKLAGIPCVNTGDSVTNKFEDGTGLSFDGFASVIGNHDALLEIGTHSNPYDWTKQPTQKQLYDKFIAPSIGKIAFEPVQNKTWWTMNLHNAKVVGINSTARGADYTEQLEWLDDVLNECRQDMTPVFIAAHYPLFAFDIWHGFNPWTMPRWYARYGGHPDTEDVEVGLYPFTRAGYNMVCSYADSGLKVLAWLSGHIHNDGLFIAGNDVKFPAICIGSTHFEELETDWANDTLRADNGIAQQDSCINIYTYNDEYNSLKCERPYCKNTVTGSTRDMWIWDYKKQDFTVMCGR